MDAVIEILVKDAGNMRVVQNIVDAVGDITMGQGFRRSFEDLTPESQATTDLAATDSGSARIRTYTI